MKIRKQIEEILYTIFPLLCIYAEEIIPQCFRGKKETALSVFIQFISMCKKIVEIKKSKISFCTFFQKMLFKQHENDFFMVKYKNGHHRSKKTEVFIQRR